MPIPIVVDFARNFRPTLSEGYVALSISFIQGKRTFLLWYDMLRGFVLAKSHRWIYIISGMAYDSNILIKGIYDAFFDQVYRYCTYRLYSKNLAEDATSEVFAKLVQRFPELRHKSLPEIRRWLFGVASNVVAAHRRQKKHQQDVFRELSQASNSGLVHDEPGFHRLDWPILYGAISQLNDKQQDILILRFFHGLETAEIARIVGMSHVAVRVTLMRTLRKLKEQLQKPFEGDQTGSP